MSTTSEALNWFATGATAVGAIAALWLSWQNNRQLRRKRPSFEPSKKIIMSRGDWQEHLICVRNTGDAPIVVHSLRVPCLSKIRLMDTIEAMAENKGQAISWRPVNKHRSITFEKKIPPRLVTDSTPLPGIQFWAGPKPSGRKVVLTYSFVDQPQKTLRTRTKI